MNKYIGTKELLAKPMTRREYNDYRGLELPANENPNDEGYLLEYLNGGKPNDDRHEGYISWSPADVFKDAYRQNGSLTFGDAIAALKHGQKVARSGWNGKGMWLSYVDPYHNNQFSIIEKNGAEGTFSPYIGMKTADNKYVPWLASQTDVLANDWMITE